MMTLENWEYNTESFQMERDLVHKTKVTKGFLESLHREDVIEILLEIYKRDLEKFLDRNKHS